MYALFVGTALPVSASAQGVTVEELVATALERSPELQVVRTEVGRRQRPGHAGGAQAKPDAVVQS